MTTYILGICDAHTATACLLRDGEIVACASEERFTRIKNQDGFPANAAKWAHAFGGIRPQDLDAVLFHSRDMIPLVMDKEFSGSVAALQMAYEVAKYPRELWGRIEDTVPALRPLGEAGWFLGHGLISRASRRDRIRIASQTLGVPVNRIHCVDHHLTHALSAYGGSSFRSDKVLVVTLDGEGDGLCSTVSVAENGSSHLKRVASTDMNNSLGYLYMAVTEHLGMKPNEHEYKVMGLAPYASYSTIQKTYPILKRLIGLEDDINKELQFRSAVRGRLYKRYLDRALKGHRFDGIAGAVQQLTEELICELVARAIRITGIRSVALGGGVFMNVKANMRVANLPEVDELFIFPSCGDESCAIGAAYFGHAEMSGTNGNGEWTKSVKPLGPLYWGPEYSDDEIEAFISQEDLHRSYRIEARSCIEERVADLLAEGKVVARFNGRMEWGARSLGNRSILAHPSDPRVVRLINEQIKCRDFWMPFAPTILKEREKDYIVNPKGIQAPYMILAFDSTDLARKELRAAMHPFDMTLRPQLLEEDWNPTYYRVLKAFEARTGVGGVLNTSFNLHGEPVVCSPADAFHVLEDSGLQHMAIGNFLVSKK